MKNYLLLLVLISNISFSQEIKEVFNGEIHSITKKVFNDEETYMKDVERYLDMSDSLVTIRYNTKPYDVFTSKFTTLEACLNDNRMLNKIVLEPNFVGEDWRILKSQRLIYTDTIISIYLTYRKPILLDRLKAIFIDRQRYIRNGIEQELSPFKFTNTSSATIQIDSTDIKRIANIECVKAIVTYDDERFKEVKHTKKYGSSKVVYEMYVTDKIKTIFHPFVNNLVILNTFYPMYVKKYATAFRGHYTEHKLVVVAKENELDNEKLETSYEELKDSLLSVYKGIINIENIKNKNSASIFQNIKKIPVPFDEQLRVLESLGYVLNPKITLKDLERELIVNAVIDTSKVTMEKYLETKPYNESYLFMGWSKFDKANKTLIPYTDKCISYSLDNLGIDVEYIYFMKRMSKITHGELSFTNIKVTVDDDSYNWIHFTVNGVDKRWKLAKVNYIDDSYITKFTYLTKEFKTKGNYTYFGTDGESFIIDYATPSEQEEFNKKTGLQREWLTGGKHFSEPND